MLRLLFIFSALILYVSPSAAQTGYSAGSQGNTVTVVAGGYQHVAGPYAALYNGPEHPDYDPRMVGTAYYGSPDWQKGDVYYHGVRFTQVPVKYDLVRNRLVVLHHNQFNKLELVNTWLDSFSVAGQSFIQLKDKVVPSAPAAGFYHRMLSGPLTVLAKREKVVREYIEGLEVKKEINEKNTHYLLKDGVYYAINSQRDLLNLMGDDRKAVQQHLRAAGVRFRRQKEDAIVLAAQFYNQHNPR